MKPTTLITTLLGAILVTAPACQTNEQSDAPKKKQAQASSSAGTGLGKALTVQQVTDFVEVLKNPKAFAGKTIRVSGLVVQHCHHRKAWFALGKKLGTKQMLRVMTRPTFLVPDDVTHGKTLADAQGVVELRTVTEQRAKHLSREHGLFGGDPAKIRGPQVIPSLRATGALFKN